MLLKETFTRQQWISLGFALTGVIYSLAAYGKLPLFGLTLAVSFAFYGYSRKRIPVGPLPGLFVETLILMIPALVYILFLMGTGNLCFKRCRPVSVDDRVGVVTSLPLLWFAAAARRLKLSPSYSPVSAPSIAFMLACLYTRNRFPFTV